MKQSDEHRDHYDRATFTPGALAQWRARLEADPTTLTLYDSLWTHACRELAHTQKKASREAARELRRSLRRGVP